MSAEFRLLGGVELWIDGAAVDIGPAKQRSVLAVLLVEAGAAVSVDQLVHRVWGDDAPLRVRSSLHSYVTRLRGAFGTAPVSITGRAGRYHVEVDEQAVDLHRFRRLVAQARVDPDDERALATYEQALALWRGEAFAGLETAWLADLRTALEQERVMAVLARNDLALRCGRHAELLPELSTAATADPLDERVAGQLMLALYRNGRQAEALEHFELIRRRLAAELGADPSPPLRRLHQRMLAADPELDGKQEQTPSDAPIPRQLPAAPRVFVGRESELDHLTSVLESELGRTVVLSAIGGTGGIGKTWLVLAWAHRHLDRFPDGQLFVDLRGFSPDAEPMPPAVAVRGFLDALGVDPGRIPVDTQAQEAMLRSLVAGKRMLMVLDNAADADQVAPLLPGGETCTVLVTSRRTLHSLITRHGAHHLALDMLGDKESLALLTQRLGPARVQAEPDAVAELVGLCGGFPLALSIIAAHAQASPRARLAEFAEELRGLGLDALAEDGPANGLADVLSWSYRALSPARQEAFGLLAISPGPGISLAAAVSLTGLAQPEAAAVLRDLENASLLGREANGRFTMHDLIRDYAAARPLPDGVREAALRRVVDFYLCTAKHAESLLAPTRPEPPLYRFSPGIRPQPLPDVAAAVAWFDTEHASLLAAQQAAAQHGWHEAVWMLAWALSTFHGRQGHRVDKLAVWRAGLAAAEHLEDPGRRVLAHRLLGNACSDLGRYEEAITHLERSLALAEELGDRANQGHTLRMLAWAWEDRGEPQAALEHAVRALDVYNSIGNPLWQAWALDGVAHYSAALGDYEVARERCRTALTLLEKHPYPDAASTLWSTLGYIERHTGHHEQAISNYRRAIALRQEIGATHQVVENLDALGHSCEALGRHDEARAAWQEALELSRAQGRAADAERLRTQLDTLPT